MVKYLLIYAVILTVLFGSLFQKNRELKQDLSQLHNSIQSFNKAQKQTTKTVSEIREKIRYVKEPCNCYNVNIPDDVLNILHTK